MIHDTIHLQAEPRWWVQPLITCSMWLAMFGLLSVKGLDRLAAFIGQRGFRLRVVE